jgi:phytoene dehydrogenase-like protein
VRGHYHVADVAVRLRDCHFGAESSKARAALPRDFLKDAKDEYDVVVIGSGLAGLTSANVLARAGRSVLLLEQHYKLGGMATWFKRPGGHIFDISLHGFPFGMVKSCRRYWSQEIADSIVQLKHIRFDNPMFSLTTSFNRDDFSRLLTDDFKVDPAAVNGFFDTARGMNFYDEQAMTTRELFEKFFPGREDVIRSPTRTAARSKTLRSVMASCSRTSCQRACLRSKAGPTSSSG